jgi:hypothetical protein
MAEVNSLQPNGAVGIVDKEEDAGSAGYFVLPALKCVAMNHAGGKVAAEGMVAVRDSARGGAKEHDGPDNSAGVGLA